MAYLLIVPLILVGLAELAVFVQVSRAVGLGWALLGVVGTAVAGAVLVRAQGMATLRRAQVSLARRELPLGELFDGICILVGGGLLLLPGFLTDLLGALLLVPPLRAVLRGTLLGWARRRGGRQQAPDAGRPPGVIDVEFEEIPPRDALTRPPADRRGPW